MYTRSIKGARCSVVGWNTMLQAGRSRVRFPVRSPNPSSRTMDLESTQLLTEISTSIVPGVKGGRRLRLATSPPWADFLENVGASTSHNSMGLHGLLLFFFKEYNSMLLENRFHYFFSEFTELDTITIQREIFILKMTLVAYLSWGDIEFIPKSTAVCTRLLTSNSTFKNFMWTQYSSILVLVLIVGFPHVICDICNSMTQVSKSSPFYTEMYCSKVKVFFFQFKQ
jgi:hypothetical protein